MADEVELSDVRGRRGAAQGHPRRPERTRAAVAGGWRRTAAGRSEPSRSRAGMVTLPGLPGPEITPTSPARRRRRSTPRARRSRSAGSRWSRTRAPTSTRRTTASPTASTCPAFRSSVSPTCRSSSSTVGGRGEPRRLGRGARAPTTSRGRAVLLHTGDSAVRHPGVRRRCALPDARRRGVAGRPRRRARRYRRGQHRRHDRRDTARAHAAARGGHPDRRAPAPGSTAPARRRDPVHGRAAAGRGVRDVPGAGVRDRFGAVGSPAGRVPVPSSRRRRLRDRADCVVRNWRSTDAERVFDIYSRWEVAKWLGNPTRRRWNRARRRAGWSSGGVS